MDVLVLAAGITTSTRTRRTTQALAISTDTLARLIREKIRNKLYSQRLDDMITIDFDDMVLESFTPITTPMYFDIMAKRRFVCTIAFPCDIGHEYTEENVKDYAKSLRPSLKYTDFDVKYTNNPIRR